MILNFPDFTNLDESHRETIKAITSKFEPYSDFNFISLYSWNTDGSTRFSLLNDNLVINMPDYITGEPVFSILGVDKMEESLRELKEVTTHLVLVPEVVINAIDNKHFLDIREDKDNNDYLYSVSKLSHLPGGEFRGKRKAINRFGREYEKRHHTEEFKFSTKKSSELKKLFEWWSEQRSKTKYEVEQESKAIDRVLGIADSHNLIGIELMIDDMIVGFSINEIIDQDYAVCHFQKTILSYNNADVFLTNEVSKKLEQTGCKYVNWEQDLGLPGLRVLKSSYKPERYLKKYSVDISKY